MAKTNTNQAPEIEITVVETPEQVAARIITGHGGVSKAIRALAASPDYQKDGKTDRGAIAKILMKRYQHVRNVLTTEPKKTV